MGVTMKRIDVEARADVLLDKSDFAGPRGLQRRAAYHVPAEYLNLRLVWTRHWAVFLTRWRPSVTAASGV